MKRSITYLKQACVLLLFAGLTACGGGEREALKSEIEQTLTEVGDEIVVLKAAKMERQGVLDGLREDLKWEYSEDLDKLVSQYASEFSRLKDNLEELNEMYEDVSGYQEKLGGMPLEYSMRLMKEMLEEDRNHLEEIVEENESVQEKFFDLTDQLDQL